MMMMMMIILTTTTTCMLVRYNTVMISPVLMSPVFMSPVSTTILHWSPCAIIFVPLCSAQPARYVQDVVFVRHHPQGVTVGVRDIPPLAFTTVEIVIMVYLKYAHRTVVVWAVVLTSAVVCVLLAYTRRQQCVTVTVVQHLLFPNVQDALSIKNIVRSRHMVIKVFVTHIVVNQFVILVLILLNPFIGHVVAAHLFRRIKYTSSHLSDLFTLY